MKFSLFLLCIYLVLGFGLIGQAQSHNRDGKHIEIEIKTGSSISSDGTSWYFQRETDKSPCGSFGLDIMLVLLIPLVLRRLRRRPLNSK
ncbi:hypothetical protein ACFL5I_00730 [Planctomycetota bacterium]